MVEVEKVFPEGTLKVACPLTAFTPNILQGLPSAERLLEIAIVSFSHNSNPYSIGSFPKDELNLRYL